MELPEEIKRIRQRSLLTQIDFAKEVKVAFSTVNRWECGKAKPNIIAAIVDKYEMDGNFNPENVVLFGYSFVWTMTEDLKMNLARLKDTEKNLRINFDVRY